MSLSRNQRRLAKKNKHLIPKDQIEQKLDRAKQLHSEGRLHAAEQLYKVILAENPFHLQTLVSLGGLAMQAGRAGVAVGLFERAVKIEPINPDCCYLLGLALQKEGNAQESEVMLLEANKYNKDNPAVLNALGLAISHQGRFDEAVAMFRQAIRIDEDYIPAYHNLSTSKKFEAVDDDFKLLENIYKRRSELGGADVSPLFFAMGKACNDLALYEAAFDAYSMGNQSVRKHRSFDIRDFEKNYERMEQYFTESTVSRFSKSGYSSEAPIFVIGMPRSGSTLVENILCNHSCVSSVGESSLLQETFGQLLRIVGPKNKDNTQDIYGLLGCMDEHSFYEMGKYYVEKMKAGVGGKNLMVVDKTLLNFLVLGVMLQMLPNATVLHCERNAMDTCLSIFQQNFTVGHDYAYDLVDIGRFYNLYRRYMKLWRRLFPSQIIDVEYELLVSETESETRRLIASCNLPWEQQCFTRDEKNSSFNTASKLQVRQPVYRSSVGRWHKYEAQLAPLVEVLAQ